MPHHRKFPPPPEVRTDDKGDQVLARDADGNYYPRYVECAGGCGWLIGCGDAIETVAHRSCDETED